MKKRIWMIVFLCLVCLLMNASAESWMKFLEKGTEANATAEPAAKEKQQISLQQLWSLQYEDRYPLTTDGSPVELDSVSLAF